MQPPEGDQGDAQIKLLCLKSKILFKNKILNHYQIRFPFSYNKVYKFIQQTKYLAGIEKL